jgi:RNA polymerase sigma factor (sigma-70 family)
MGYHGNDTSARGGVSVGRRADDTPLVLAAQRDVEAMSELYVRYTRFLWSRVWRVMKRRGGECAMRGLDMDDLHQVACEAFLQAVKRFNPALGVRFITYCGTVVDGKLISALNRTHPGGITGTVLPGTWPYRLCSLDSIPTADDGDPLFEGWESLLRTQRPFEDDVIAAADLAGRYPPGSDERRVVLCGLKGVKSVRSLALDASASQRCVRRVLRDVAEYVGSPRD